MGRGFPSLSSRSLVRAPVATLASALCLVWALPVVAADVVLSPDTSSPFATVQDAIDAAVDGDTIYLQPGTYTSGAIDSLGKDIRIFGVGGRAATKLEILCSLMDFSDLDWANPYTVFVFPLTFEGSPPTAELGEVTVDVSCGALPSPSAVVYVVIPRFVGGVLAIEGGWTGLTAIPGWAQGPPAVDDSCLGCPGGVYFASVQPTNWVRRSFVYGQWGAPENSLISNSVIRGGIGSHFGAQLVSSTVAFGEGASAWMAPFLPPYSSPAIYGMSHTAFTLVESSDLSGSSIFAGSGAPLQPVVSYSNLFPLRPDQVVYTQQYQPPNYYPIIPYDPMEDPTGLDGNISADPGFIQWLDDDNIWNDNLCPGFGAPTVDAGDPDPSMNDPDGSRNDIGAFGGPDAMDCTRVLDADGDGYFPIMGDCDDGDPGRRPWLPEVGGDGIDQDCDGVDLADNDADGFFTPLDCNDNASSVHPGAVEVCDGVDQDCNMFTFAPGGEVDADGDTVLSCVDCDDLVPTVLPGAPEICDGLDSDCDPGTTAPGGEDDADADGSPLCSDCDDFDPFRAPALPELCDGADQDCEPSTVAEGGEMDSDLDDSLGCADCDDADPSRAPGLEELCDGMDQDCDPAESAKGGERDVDADGHLSCADCDDGDASIHPGAVEGCDGLDTDCELATEAPGGEQDVDLDGAYACVDCADLDPTRSPGAIELCDGIDQDCDAATTAPGGEGDTDGDFALSCSDCDDSDPLRAPAFVEICDGADQDCDPATFAKGDEGDADGDGFIACIDCVDTDATVAPGLPELCDGVDQDCLAVTTAVGGEGDSDLDGVLACADCDDEDATRLAVTEEVECDGVDQDCDGLDLEPLGGCTTGDDDSALEDDDSAPGDDDSEPADDDSVPQDDDSAPSDDDSAPGGDDDTPDESVGPTVPPGAEPGCAGACDDLGPFFVLPVVLLGRRRRPGER